MEEIKKNIFYLLFILSLIATIMSLYFSEFLHFTPCVLCWYQRICMYPLPIIFLVSIIRKNKDAVFYALPFSIVGFLIAIYHNLLYYKIIPEAISPCTATLPCTQQQLLLFGFFTIPLGSLISFFVLNLLLIFYLFLARNKKIKKTI